MIAPAMSNVSAACERSARQTRAKDMLGVPLSRISADAQVDEAFGNYDYFRDVTTFDRRLDLFVGECSLASLIVAGACTCEDSASQLAVHLHRDFDFLFTCELGVELRPRRYR